MAFHKNYSNYFRAFLVKDSKDLFLIANILNGQQYRLVFLKGQILGPLLLLYINDPPENLESSAKLFADDTSLFSIVYNLSESVNLLNDDLKKITEWAFK